MTRVFYPNYLNLILADYESPSIRETALRIVSHREAQKCGARHLQKCAPQTTARLT
jgi:hypothetical protein